MLHRQLDILDTVVLVVLTADSLRSRDSFMLLAVLALRMRQASSALVSCCDRRWMSARPRGMSRVKPAAWGSPAWQTEGEQALCQIKCVPWRLWCGGVVWRGLMGGICSKHVLRARGLGEKGLQRLAGPE